MFEFVVSFYRLSGSVLACAYQPHSPTWRVDRSCITVAAIPIGSEPTLDVRIERSPNTGGTWEGFYRNSPASEWVTLGRIFTPALAYGGTGSVDANLRAGVWLSQVRRGGTTVD